MRFRVIYAVNEDTDTGWNVSFLINLMTDVVLDYLSKHKHTMEKP